MTSVVLYSLFLVQLALFILFLWSFQPPIKPSDSRLRALPSDVAPPTDILPLPSGAARTDASQPRMALRQSHTLIIYSYFENEAEDYKSNLEFFLRHAAGKSPHVTFDLIVVLSGAHTVDLARVRAIGPHVRVVERENVGFDFGSHVHGLDEARQWRGSTERYTYFVLLNSSVRGPFLPRYALGTMHWTQALTSKLNSVVKMVGTSVSCTMVVHVQSMLLAVDQQGLAVLIASKVLAPKTNISDAIKYGELVAARAIMAAGFSVDSLMYRYRGVDWRDPANADCNERLNPFGPGYNDGISLHPIEVLFVKAKATWHRYLAHDRWHSLARAVDGRIAVTENRFALQTAKRARLRDLEQYMAETQCDLAFDTDFYLRQLLATGVAAEAWPAHALYAHWKARGFELGVGFRWRARPGVRAPENICRNFTEVTRDIALE